MYKFIQKNQKKFLAIFAAGLMIVFILPSSMNQFGGGRAEHFGTLAGEDVTTADVGPLVNEWKNLSQIPVEVGFRQVRPLTEMLLGPVAAEIDRNEDLFFLLVRESERAGIRIPPDRVEQLLNSPIFQTIPAARRQEMVPAVTHFLMVGGLLDRAAENVKISEPVLRHRIATQLQDVKLNLVELDANAMKEQVPAPTDAELTEFFNRHRTTPASQPATTQPDDLGFGYRYPDRVKLQYITIPREQLKQAVLAKRDPYGLEVEARQYYLKNKTQFPYVEPTTTPATSASTAPAATAPATTETSPAVKPETENEPSPEPPTEPKPEAAPAEPQPQGDTESEFEDANAILAADEQPAARDAGAPAPATDPKPDAASLPASSPASAPAPAATKPTTKPAFQPFETVKDEIIDIILKPAIDRLAADIRSTVSTRSAADFQAYRASQSSAAGSAEGGAPVYASFEYLERLADDIQKQFGVRPTIAAKANEWTPVAELSELAGIGSAMAGRETLQTLVERAAPFHPSATTAPAGKPLPPDAPLQLMQLSPALTDFDVQNTYFFRLADAQRARAPESLDEVKEQVASDLRVQRAFKQAQEQAVQIAAKAKETGLASAATGQRMITTGTFNRRYAQPFNLQMGMFGGLPIPKYDKISEDAKRRLVEQAYEQLLARATPDIPNPVAVIELPTDRKVLVAELAAVSNPFHDDMTFAQANILQQLRGQQAQRLWRDWFSYDAVAQRLDWKPDRPPTTRPSGEEVAVR